MEVVAMEVGVKVEVVMVAGLTEAAEMVVAVRVAVVTAAVVTAAVSMVEAGRAGEEMASGTARTPSPRPRGVCAAGQARRASHSPLQVVARVHRCN